MKGKKARSVDNQGEVEKLAPDLNKELKNLKSFLRKRGNNQQEIRNNCSKRRRNPRKIKNNSAERRRISKKEEAIAEKEETSRRLLLTSGRKLKTIYKKMPLRHKGTMKTQRKKPCLSVFVAPKKGGINEIKQLLLSLRLEIHRPKGHSL